MRSTKKPKSPQRSRPGDIEAEIAKAIRKVRSAKSVSIARVRKTSGLSEVQFAKLLDTSLATFRQWQKGKSKPDEDAKKLIQIIDVVSKVIDKMPA